MDYIEKEETSEIITFSEWLLTLFLICIPFFNVGILLFWSFAKGMNPSKQGFARAFLIFVLIGYAAWFFFLRALFR